MSDKKHYPIYGENLPQKGLYLGLLHGRKTENERLSDWGENGAVIGPLKFVHTTYGCEVNIQFTNQKDAKKYGLGVENSLSINDGLLEFDGMLYGDWTVFYGEGNKYS